MCPTGQVRRADSKGFTFLELLITAVILSVGIAALVAAFSEGVFASSDTAALRTASALAQARIEELRGTPFANIVTEARAAVPGFTGFDRQLLVTVSPGGTNVNFKQADVTVYWTIKGGELSTALTTYFVNN